ncbi:carbon starvation CstA family protein [Plebeiibacterium sediminum]|uniref:Carbon starvation protein A n=1 Tax=Plebeiibacterium sediminum TaxID=2992112 RepID=A0AAE3M417_9BACT|nr:carbon starvation CstA family protein [Plebeiobacterium sediminum]MCW3786395.1 carbon starvation protein A [Plebeiobacterium sediminum]
MITFIVSIALLVLGFVFYGRFIEKFFGADDSIKTPAVSQTDGVDFTPLPTWKVFTIQFLNIAGLGPVFGAILGAQYGQWAYVWIVVGCIFMGAVHDYFSGMLSLRNGGASVPELVGKYLGNGFRQLLRVFTLLLLIFVGVAFVSGPAGLLAYQTNGGFEIWVYIIFGYYLLATLLPINKIIGKIYPFFAVALLLMAVGIAAAMMINYWSGNFQMQELSLKGLKNLHQNPAQNILFPMMFIVISCGAISGFHSTQAPMMARCLKKESYGRYAFYGAMVAEGIVAIIWATAAMNYFGDANGLNEAMLPKAHNPAWVVNMISEHWMGKVGAIFVIVGVIVLPISTGDTAFRSARLTLADVFSYSQTSIKSRLIISIPLFIIGFVLTQLEFTTIWKFLGLSNQVLSVVMLWTVAMYLKKSGKNHWLLTIPAMFMTTVCASYLLVAPFANGGFGLDVKLGVSLGIIVAFIALGSFLYRTKIR